MAPRPDGVPPDATREHVGRAAGNVDVFEWHLRSGNSFVAWSDTGMKLREVETDGTLTIRDDVYTAGELSRRLTNDGTTKTQSFFKNGKPHQVTTYRNHENDVETTYFEDGDRRYSYRRERRSPTHRIRYDDGAKVFEAEWSADKTTPPTKVEYYDLDGTVIFRYVSKGSGKGELCEVDATGAVTRALSVDEAERNQYGHWDFLLPGASAYSVDRPKRDPDYARHTFALDLQRETAAIDALPLDDSLRAALGAERFEEDDSAMGATNIGQLVAGLLHKKKDIAEQAHGLLLRQIVHQDTVFPAGYRVATALAKLFPTLTPAAKKRAQAVIDEVLGQEHVKSNAKSYAEIVAALPPKYKVPR